MKSRLNVLLAERRMTKRQLQDAVGMCRTKVWILSTDSGIERARMSDLMAIADVIGCSVKDLFEE